MSKSAISNSTIRELVPSELDQVSGGIRVSGGGVHANQPVHVPATYTVKRVTGVLTQLVKKL